MSKILIIDDDSAFGELVAELLGSAGHSALALRSGRSALELVQLRFRPDLILVDLKMESMDGFETIKRLRAEPSCEGAVIVMLTASKSDDAALEARRHGAQGFLSKPIEPTKLNQQVTRLLEDARVVWIDDHHSVTLAA